jgi:hypothetical protein
MLRSEGVERILLLCLSFVMLSFFVWKEVRIFVAETDCLKELKQPDKWCCNRTDKKNRIETGGHYG